MCGDFRLVDMKAYVNGRLGGIEAGACGAYGAYGAALLSTYYLARTVVRTMYEFRCTKFPTYVRRTAEGYYVNYRGYIF